VERLWCCELFRRNCKTKLTQQRSWGRSALLAHSSTTDFAASETIELHHADIDRVVHRLSVLHGARLHCDKGCASCCADDLSVFAVEAELIESMHSTLLKSELAGPIGGCAFLNSDLACRIYAERPFVCRSQGVPMRWVEEAPDDVEGPTAALHEYRDICPLNEAGPALETLDADACLTLGSFEERLALLQIASALPNAARVTLRSLFTRG
jgi:uncharacterized protein